MSPTVDPLDLVSLGPWEDLDPGCLEVPGADWDDAVHGVTEDLIGPDLMQAMPRTGWRPLAIPERDDGDEELFAAPADGGWALLSVARSDHGVRLSGDPGPYRLRSGRPRRREGLELVWPTGAACSPDELSQRHVILVNRLDRIWVADPEDRSYAHGFLLDGQEQSVHGGFVAYAPLQFPPLQNLEPGGTLALPVDFGPSALGLPAGEYGVLVVLSSLGLRSSPATVTLVKA